MHDTYGNSNAYDEMKLNYEEELTPKEINRHKKAPSKKSFTSFASDDLLLILILFILLNDDKEDNSLAIIIAALLFIK